MVDMDKIVSLSKRRGFIFQPNEIYGAPKKSFLVFQLRT